MSLPDDTKFFLVCLTLRHSLYIHVMNLFLEIIVATIKVKYSKKKRTFRTKYERKDPIIFKYWTNWHGSFSLQKWSKDYLKTIFASEEKLANVVRANSLATHWLGKMSTNTLSRCIWGLCLLNEVLLSDQVWTEVVTNVPCVSGCFHHIHHLSAHQGSLFPFTIFPLHDPPFNKACILRVKH